MRRRIVLWIRARPLALWDRLKTAERPGAYWHRSFYTRRPQIGDAKWTRAYGIVGPLLGRKSHFDLSSIRL